MIRILIALGCIVASAAQAQGESRSPAAEMQSLLAKGLLVNSSDLDNGKVFTAKVNLAADGKLSGSITPAGDKAIPLSGSWALKGAQLCRKIEPIEPDEVCETWLRSGPKEAIIQVNGKNTSINRW